MRIATMGVDPQLVRMGNSDGLPPASSIWKILDLSARDGLVYRVFEYRRGDLGRFHALPFRDGYAAFLGNLDRSLDTYARGAIFQ